MKLIKLWCDESVGEGIGFSLGWRGLKEVFFGEGVFELEFECKEGVSRVKIWEKNVLGRGRSKYKDFKLREKVYMLE